MMVDLLTVGSLNSGVLKSVGHIAHTFTKDEGILRIFVKNRPVNLVCPGKFHHHAKKYVFGVLESGNDFDLFLGHLRDNFDLDRTLHAPSQKLKLEWVYGYRGKDAR